MANVTSYNTVISVVITVGKILSYVDRCIESSLSQTLREIEVILVDLGVAEESTVLCDSYAKRDGRIRVIHHNNNCVGSGFNKGLDVAKGEYIAFLDPCDWLEPEMYEVLYDIALSQNIDVVHCLKYSHKDRKKTKVANAFLNTNNNMLVRYVNSKSDYKFYVPMLLFYSEDLYSTIYRKDFLTKNQIKFSELPGSNAQNLGFTFLVFCYLGSFYIHEAPLYHLNSQRSYFTNKSFKTAIESIGEYYHIKELIEQRGLEDKYIGKRYLHIAMAKIFRHIRHRFFVHCKTISQKQEFLNSVKPILQNYYPLKNDNMFLNGSEKRLYKRLIRHPLKTSIKYNFNSIIKRLGKTLLTDISFHKKHKQIRILGVRFLFYKSQSDYNTFNLLHVPIIKRRIYRNIQDNTVTTNHYFLGMLYAKDTIKNDWRRSAWFANMRKYNPIYNTLAGANQLSLDNKVINLHCKIFPSFKNSNNGKCVCIFGKGNISDDATTKFDGKIIACNKNINIFSRNPDYIFASEHIASDDYYNKLITSKDSTVFFDYTNADNIMLAMRARYSLHMINATFYYGDWRFYKDIQQNLDHGPLAFFGDTVHSAMHFALYTNPAIIYLIGCDIYDEGIRKNNRQFAPTAENLLIGYRKLKLLKDSYYPNTRIVCVNPSGLKGIFEEEYTNNYLNKG